MFFFIPTISISATLIDNDDTNTWINVGAAVYAEDPISADQLFITLDYGNVEWDGKGIYNNTVGNLQTDRRDLFEAFREFHFYLADPSEIYGSTNYFPSTPYYYILDFHYDGTPGPNDTHLLTIIINKGSNPNNVQMLDFYEFYVPTVLPPAFFIHFDFSFGTFRFFWGNELFTMNIPLDDFEDFRAYNNNNPSYNMHLYALNELQNEVPLFYGSDWQSEISNDPEKLFEYFNITQEFYNSYASLGLDNFFPQENNGGGVFNAFDRLFISIGLIDGTWNYDANGNYASYTINDTSGMIILYLIILLILFYLLRKISSSSFPMIIVGLLITSLFMFLGYLPLFVSITLIGFFIVSIISMNKGGMLGE
jgi:hypothetical protein